MKYSEAFDIAERAIAIRKQMIGARYPEGAARTAALAIVGAVGTGEVIEKATAALVAIERPFHSNPAWDGSIG